MRGVEREDEVVEFVGDWLRHGQVWCRLRIGGREAEEAEEREGCRDRWW